ncbi:hypothetical protein [Actinocorallia libanotica]|uniref:Uncharacterized protein n=1 Tax=Actinocorallia libanotica TaxID=46162 RepID=A0ABP4CEN0_9ACTN
MIEVHTDGWLFRVVDPAFELVIPHWEGMDPATAQEADATIYLPDGTRRYATFMTLEGIAKIMSRWQETGECLNGRYFYCTDLVVINGAGFNAMADAIRDLISTGDLEHACGLLPPED